MLQLLNYKSKRLLNIIELLILESGFVSFKQIERKNRCSNKTVYDDLHFLRNEFQETLRLQIYQNNVKSYGFTMYDYEKFRNKLINESLHFQILIALAFKGPLSVSDLAWRFNYSESRIRNVIDELNEHMALYEVSLVSHNGLFYFKSKNVETVIILLEKILSFDLKNDLSKASDQKYSNSFYNQFRPLKNLELPKLIHTQLKNYYYIYYSISKEVIISKSKRHKFLKNESIEIREIDEIRRLLQNTSFDISDKEQDQMVSIINYYKYLLRINSHRIMREYNRYDYFYLSFSAENSKTILLYEEYLRVLSKNIGDDFLIYKEEILFHIYTSVRSFRIYERKKIAVYSDLCCCHAASIVQSIEKHFPMHFVTVMDFDENIDVDFIITTKLLEDYLDINQVLISDYLTIEDIYNIYSSIYLNKNNTLVGNANIIESINMIE